LGEAWERYADDWIAWARTSPHDRFADATWPELRVLLPDPDGLTLEIGCGEGRVGRALSALGHQVIGIELSATLAGAARHAEPALTVARADAAALPIADGAANLVVACMSLQDIDDLNSAVHETARVLRAGGQFCIAIVHPFASAEDHSTLDTGIPMITQSYLRERRYEDHVERDGSSMTFDSQHRPLGSYITAFADAGFVLSALREFGRRPIPWLLVARLEKARRPDAAQ
jgi:SAM-dependent methyltransferase